MARPRKPEAERRTMREGQTASRNGRVPVLAGDAGQPGGQVVGQRVLQRLEAALDTLPGRTVGWERPRSGGADGDVHRHPARCRSRHSEMGGRSQPRPRWPDRHRRSGGRGTTASAPATYGTGGVSIADAISCPATPEAPCTLVDRHRHGRLALKTDPPTDGSTPSRGGRWRLRRHRGTPSPRRQPCGGLGRRYAAGDDGRCGAQASRRTDTGGKGAAPPMRDLQGSAILGGIEGGQGHPSPAPVYYTG